MFDLYHAPDQAAYRQAQLLDEIAADRLAREARTDIQTSTDDGASRAPRVVAWVTDVLSAVTGAIHAATQRPHRI